MVPFDFDWEVYCVFNDDLWKSGIQTQQKAISYWMLYGKNEKRIYKLKPYEYKIIDNLMGTFTTRLQRIEHYYKIKDMIKASDKKINQNAYIFLDDHTFNEFDLSVEGFDIILNQQMDVNKMYEYISSMDKIYKNVIVHIKENKTFINKLYSLNFVKVVLELSNDFSLTSDLSKADLVIAPNFDIINIYKNKKISFSNINYCVDKDISPINIINLLSKKIYNYEYIHSRIKPFAIYFPQFHEVPENNINFYPGYTDMIALKECKDKQIHNLISPHESLGYYDLTDDITISKQIDLAREYGFYGFGIYYYWFSDNNITNKNMIFEKVIDKFFETEFKHDFKVFFIYCNEDWTKNPSFASQGDGYKIQNIFNEENIKANVVNLRKYMSHPNYYKIDSKPVFAIHHPFLITDDEVNNIYNILNNDLKEDGFKGVEFIINSMVKSYPQYINYNHHANYKTNKTNTFIANTKNVRYIDYYRYIFDHLEHSNDDTAENISTIFTNFDTTPRFHSHSNKSLYVTKTLNNSIHLFGKFLDIQFEKYAYKRNETTKLFFVNAWNEWGEQMVMEPSREHGYIYLEKFREKLFQYFGNTSSL